MSVGVVCRSSAWWMIRSPPAGCGSSTGRTSIIPSEWWTSIGADQASPSSRRAISSQYDPSRVDVRLPNFCRYVSHTRPLPSTPTCGCEYRVVRSMVVIATLSLSRCPIGGSSAAGRSEEHTSELQSLTNLVCRLLLEKKKKKENTKTNHNNKKNTTRE